jgi:hypothetical protein
MLNKRVTIAKRVAQEMGDFGMASGGQKYEILGTFWSAEDFNRGTKALREGAVDAYDTVMFRMRYHEGIDRWCLLKYQNRWYQIESFNENYQLNQIQITAHEMSNQDVTIVDPPTPTTVESAVNPEQQNDGLV